MESRRRVSALLLCAGRLCIFRVSDQTSMSSNKEKAKHPPPAEAPTAPGMTEAPAQAVAPEMADAATPPEPEGAAPPTPTPAPAESRSPAAVEPSLTPEQRAALQAKAAKADEHWDRLLRAKADLDNYKKRATRERHDAVRYANLSLMEKLMPALDSFDRALAATNSANGNDLESLKAGIAMVHSQIMTALTEAGLQEIDATQQAFDPNVHEALSQQESADVPEGQVLHQVRKGYKLHERLIRPAAVVVAKKPAA